MKHPTLRHTGLSLSAILVLLALAGCADIFTPYVPNAGALAGKTMVYQYYQTWNIFGTWPYHTTATYVFDSNGTAGTYSIEIKTYAYSNAADAATQDASKKTWRQYDGERGTFTYNASNYELAQTITHKYVKTASAVLVDSSYYDLYSWQTLLEINTPNTAYSEVRTRQATFNQDNMNTFVYDYKSDGLYGKIEKKTISKTAAGVTTKEVTTTSTELTVQRDALSKTVTEVIDNTVGSNPTTTTTTTTEKKAYAYSVIDWVEVGSTSSLKDFGFSWKEGKALTFFCNQTQYDHLKYTGNTAPQAPSSFTDGIGLTGINGTAPFYYIDRNQSGLALSFENYGDHLVEINDGAGR